jgi:hypothetical protein
MNPAPAALQSSDMASIGIESRVMISVEGRDVRVGDQILYFDDPGSAVPKRARVSWLGSGYETSDVQVYLDRELSEDGYPLNRWGEVEGVGCGDMSVAPRDHIVVLRVP